jgi:NitT/TauT family transport system permease protein
MPVGDRAEAVANGGHVDVTDDADPTDTIDAGETAGAAGAGEAAGGEPVVRRGQRGRPLGRLHRVRGDRPLRWRVGLGAAGLAGLIALWLVAASATSGANEGIVVPSPAATWDALRELQTEGLLFGDILASTERILYGYGISIAIGIVVGLAMGAFPSAEGTLEAPIGFVRYIPASALTPLMLLWLGIDEAPKIALIVVGTVFYNILMVADVARSVPRQLIDAAATLGASRRRIMARVVWPHSVPGIIDVARINLASGWLMLVVAELLATDEGLAVRVARATRFRAYDRMFAVLLVFGLIGMLSDLALRALRRWAAPWDK